MPRFYLHIENGSDMLRDMDGAEFVSLSDALKEARAVAKDLMIDAVRSGREDVPECVVIAGDNDDELASVFIDEVLPQKFRTSKAT